MRKTYTKAQKSKKIRQQALEQLRKTRAKLLKDHPLLMKKMAILAKRHAPPLGNEAEKAPKIPENNHLKDTPPRLKPHTNDLQVDKEKNVQAVLKYLEIKEGHPALNVAVKAMLSKNRT